MPGRLVDAYRRHFEPAQVRVRVERRAAAGVGGSGGRFLEHGLRFVADTVSGQKTGFFLDQRENRRSGQRIATRPSGAEPVLLFGRLFGRRALREEPRRAVDVDGSEAALSSPGASGRRTSSTPRRKTSSAPTSSRTCAPGPPPANGGTSSSAIRPRSPEEGGCRPRGPRVQGRGAAGDDARLAGRNPARVFLFRPRVSGALPADPLRRGARRRARFLHHGEGGRRPDHPVSIYCPESEYLKAFYLSRRIAPAEPGASGHNRAACPRPRLRPPRPRSPDRGGIAQQTMLLAGASVRGSPGISRVPAVTRGSSTRAGSTSLRAPRGRAPGDTGARRERSRVVEGDGAPPPRKRGRGRHRPLVDRVSGGRRCGECSGRRGRVIHDSVTLSSVTTFSITRARHGRSG